MRVAWAGPQGVAARCGGVRHGVFGAPRVLKEVVYKVRPAGGRRGHCGSADVAWSESRPPKRMQTAKAGRTGGALLVPRVRPQVRRQARL